jgi:hypothetical protein
MSSVTAAPTVAEGAANTGGGHLSYYFCIKVHTDVITISQAYGKTLKCFVAKQFSVLFGKTL